MQRPTINDDIANNYWQFFFNEINERFGRKTLNVTEPQEMPQIRL